MNLLDQITLCLVFLRHGQTFPKSAPSYTPTSIVKGFQLLHIFPQTTVVCFKKINECIDLILFLAALHLRCCAGFPSGSEQALFLLQVTDFLHWALGCTGSVVWHIDLAAPRHVGSSQLRYQTLSSAWAGRFSATGPAAKPPAAFWTLSTLVGMTWYLIVVLI